MTSRPDAATLVPIEDVSSAFKGFKVRTAGMISEYDRETTSITLRSGKSTIQVDVSFIIDDIASADLLRSGSDVFAIGVIECSSNEKEDIKLNCIQMFDCTGLDLFQWEQAARKMSQLIHQRAEGKSG